MRLPKEEMVRLLRERIPDLLAVYAYGSQIDGTATANSDLDLAVFIPYTGDELLLFNLANEISDLKC